VVLSPLSAHPEAEGLVLPVGDLAVAALRAIPFKLKKPALPDLAILLNISAGVGRIAPIAAPISSLLAEDGAAVLADSVPDKAQPIQPGDLLRAQRLRTLQGRLPPLDTRVRLALASHPLGIAATREQTQEL
jgi:hypothetical protein